MNSIILQPAGSNDAREHYSDTIQRPVDINRIKKFVSEDEFAILSELYLSGSVPTWGVTPGKDNGNKNKWDRINIGDVTLFSRKGAIYATGVVTYKLQNKELAESLWGKDGSGQTWENIYFLDEINDVNIPYSVFNAAAGYKPNNVIQGFTILNHEISQKIFDAFDLTSNIYLPEISLDEYNDAISVPDPNQPLDAEGKTKVRKEQTFLRRQLFRNRKVAKCGICSEIYPVTFLVAAHIKKRSKCTHDEKLDFKNIVMPMCKFGCDELFEKGYIRVLDGRISLGKKTITSLAVQKYISSIEGLNCLNWTVSSEKYFAWHAENNA